GMPFVLLKLAVSLDGRVTAPPGGPRWTSSEASRDLVHEMRSTADGVMVGIGTVLADDPRLTDRRQDAASRQPVRLIVDTHLRTPIGSAALREETGRTIVICGDGSDAARGLELERSGATVWTAPIGSDGMLDLKQTLRRATADGLLNIMAEGGPTLATSLLNNYLVDRVAVFIAPRFYGSRSRHAIDRLDEVWWSDPNRFENAVWRQVGDDCLFEADVKREETTRCSRD
ncbi:MAG: RibD family protein, partial [Candidatus Eisenbacteria bacterium]|nr:RibD family protein [Candidatus Eisenbacteria bacterium]